MKAAAFVAALAVFVGACGGGGDGGEGHDHAEADGGAASSETTAPPFAKADANTAVDVTLQDYAFVGLPDTITGPNVAFAASIKGSNTHELVVLDDGGEVVGDLRPFKRPATQSLAVVLEPGTYSVQCLVKEGSRTHAELGMRKTVTVSS